MSPEPLTAQHPARRVLRFMESLAASPVALSFERQEERFGELALELFAWQFARNEPYARLCSSRHRTPAEVSHWTQIPAAPTGAFKEFDFTCLPEADREITFHSSGTTAHKPSRHFHSAVSIELYHASLLPWFRHHFPRNHPPPPLLSLTPPGLLAPHSSLVHMLEVVRKEAGSLDSWFAGGTDAAGVWVAEPEKVLAWLNRHTVLHQPVIVAGTAFNFVHLVDWMINRDVLVHLPPGSAVMETGGYKGRSRALPQSELHTLISDRLGVPAASIVCEYGMCELSSQAYDRVAGADGTGRTFRFPPWVRARIVSAEDGSEVGVGRAGLLQIFDLANAFSVLAVQTEDLALRQMDGFELLGRSEAVEPRGCSLLPA